MTTNKADRPFCHSDPNSHFLTVFCLDFSSRRKTERYHTRERIRRSEPSPDHCRARQRRQHRGGYRGHKKSTLRDNKVREREGMADIKKQGSERLPGGRSGQKN